MYVNLVFVIRCLYSAVSLTLVKEQHFIRIIYYYYYYKYQLDLQSAGILSTAITTDTVNMQGFVWKFFLCATHKFSFIHSFTTTCTTIIFAGSIIRSVLLRTSLTLTLDKIYSNRFPNHLTVHMCIISDANNMCAHFLFLF